MTKRIIMLMLIAISLSASAQQSMFKALFMFNFAKYIEWPNSLQQNQFVIGIYGNDDIEVELKKLAASRKINTKSIVVKNVKSLSEAAGANIIYVSQSKSSNINEVVNFFKNKPTLIISDKANMCKKGAHINYVTVGGKMKFEINKSNLKSNLLNVSPKLISLGIEVQ